MTLAVIGVGLGRTGTTSLKLALEQLGFGPCHHMSEVFKNTSQLPHWLLAASGERVDWMAVLAGYRATVDWPSVYYWRDLCSAFPNARVILSIRPEDSWWRSFSTTIRELLMRRDEVADPYRRSVLQMANRIIARGTFGGDMSRRDTVLARYAEHNSRVVAEISADRLLVFDVADGWPPLCRFLGTAVPETAFPRANDRDEFWAFFGDGLERH